MNLKISIYLCCAGKKEYSGSVRFSPWSPGCLQLKRLNCLYSMLWHSIPANLPPRHHKQIAYVFGHLRSVDTYQFSSPVAVKQTIVSSTKRDINEKTFNDARAHPYGRVFEHLCR